MRFAEEERDYKVRAHKLALELLNLKAFDSLLREEKYAEICKRALRVANATNLIFPNEKMALKDGLSQPDSEKLFAVQLYELLWKDGDLEKRFMSFAEALEEIKASKWPIVSYFSFIVHPDQFMFIKPTVTQHCASLCAFEINYKSNLNWLTYQSVLKFSNYLREQISELKPRDMIDVQSFMWCITPGVY